MKMTVTLDQDVASVLEERSRMTGRTIDEVTNEAIRLTLRHDQFWSERPARRVVHPKKVRISASGRSGPRKSTVR